MNTLSFRRHVLSLPAILILIAVPTYADQNLAGNVTVTGGATTGNLNVTGAIDSDSNTFTFGTQGTSFGGAMLYQDNSVDTLTFSINRNPASWLWLHNTAIPAMRLDSTHQLILYQANGTTAGVTLAPVTSQLSLGTATLTASGMALSTNGPLTVGGNITNTTGSLTGGTSGLALNAGGTNQNITLNSSGTGDLVFNAGGAERARIKSTGNVGIGTSSAAQKLDVAGIIRASTNPSAPNDASAAYFWNQGGVGPTLSGLSFDLQTGGTGAQSSRLRVDQNGNVGIGTTSPTARLEVNTGGGASGQTGLYVYHSANSGSDVANFTSNWLDGNGGNLLRVNNASGNALTITSSRNVGIGTTSPSYTLDINGQGRFAGTLNLTGVPPALYVISQPTNPTYATAASVLNKPTFTVSGTYYPIATTGYAQQVISANVRNNGYLMGFDGGGFRADPADAGSLNTLYGMRLQYGHYTTLNASAHTDTVIGLSLEPYYQVGTIGNIYGLMIGGSPGASVSGNVYGVYQTDGNAKNYFAGNVGIGTTTPTAKLEVRGDIRSYLDGADSVSGQLYFANSANSRAWNWQLTANGSSALWGYDGTTWAEKMRVGSTGNVGIGTTNPTQKLSVAGSIRAYEVIVDTGWSDYVFDDSYKLKTLSEVEAYVKTEKHLPGIPSAKEVAEHGVSIGDMQSKMLAKIEELTLHQIEQEKHQIAQEKEISALKAQNAGLERQVAELQSSAFNR